MGKIIKKQYYKISFALSSPLALGSGFNEETDKDILKDSKGNPFIPASSIAGVSRSLLQGLSDAELKEYFGFVSQDGNSEANNSKITFYDATIVAGTPHISVRDGVGLDEYKVAIKGAKFDMEVLEPGVNFATYIEQNYYSEDEKNVAESVASLWGTKQLYLGAKTMRGYGSVCDVKVEKKEFDLQNKESVEAWLSFDMYDEWKNAEILELKSDECDVITLELEQVSGISIRKYTTRVNTSNEDTAVPDSEQLTIWNSGEEIPVIPGSTWAGAFLHRMEELVPEEDLTVLFGKIDKSDIHRKSVIRFSETQIKDATKKVLTRNAIDRFSGGASDSALFTEMTYYNGNTVLEIGFSDKSILSQKAASALAATIADLGYGFLGIGGLTAIGRGLFKIVSVNGEAVTDEEVYQTVLDILTEEK